MSPLLLVTAGAGAIAFTGLAALALRRAPRAATLVAAIGAVGGAAVGLLGAVSTLGGGGTQELAAPWAVPGGGFVLGLDPLSAFFLAPLLVLGPLCAVYGRSYLGNRVVPAAELNLLVAAMVLVLIARHGLLFLVAWEAMALLAYLLVTSDHGQAEVRRAGWAYLVGSHVGVSALIALFVALGAGAGGALDFTAITDAWSDPGAGIALILPLALIGFGFKAGVVGLHVWLPEAHAAAPSHVSALMSGVLIKLGIYGLLRVTTLVPVGAELGVALMVLGIGGALLGMALALYQRDLKRVLAYSSVENVGVILLGLGLGLWARAEGHAGVAALAFAGGLLHVWNHAAMKGLMFLCAGSVVHATGTRDVERLGGLMRRMPWTGRAMMLGAVAIAGLPPLNAFASEWLLYRALMRVGLDGESSSSLAAVCGVAALALVGGLAALCFVRLAGVVLLGTPRSVEASGAHESPLAMTGPVVALAAACVVGALAAPALVGAQASVLADLHAAGATELAAARSALSPVTLSSAALLAAAALAAIVLARRVRGAPVSETWGCGYAVPTARMQYTGRGFAELFHDGVLPRWVRARLRARPPEGVFPTSASFETDAADPLTRGAYEPFLIRWGDRLARLRFLQQGNVHIYILYIVAAAIVSLGWVTARDWALGQGWWRP